MPIRPFKRVVPGKPPLASEWDRHCTVTENLASPESASPQLRITSYANGKQLFELGTQVSADWFFYGTTTFEGDVYLTENTVTFTDVIATGDVSFEDIDATYNSTSTVVFNQTAVFFEQTNLTINWANVSIDASTWLFTDVDITVCGGSQLAIGGECGASVLLIDRANGGGLVVTDPPPGTPVFVPLADGSAGFFAVGEDGAVGFVANDPNTLPIEGGVIRAAGGPVWVGPIEVDEADFTAPATIEAILLYSLAARGVIQAVAHRVTEAWGNGAGATLTLSVGTVGSVQKYLPNTDMTVTSETYTPAGGHAIESFSGATSINVRAVSSVNVNTLTTGHTQFWLLVGSLGA